MLSDIKLAFRSLDVSSLATLYKTLVRPLLEYCCIIWSPYFIKDIEIIEKVQRRFTPFLPECSDMPYKDRLKYFNLSSLYSRGLFIDIVHVFKIVKGFLHIDPGSFFNFSTNSKTRGHRYKITGFCSRLDVRKFWFSSRF